MTKIRRLTTALGLAGGMTLASFLAVVAPAMALTPEEVARKLNNIPVFTLFNPELKKFAVASLNVDGKSLALVPSYVDRGDAERLLQEQQRSNAEAAKKVEIKAIPLSLIYLETQSKKTTPNEPTFQVVPDEDEIKIAVKMRAADGATEQNWRGIPLFYAPNLGITLPTQEGNSPGRSILPMYFSRSDIESYIAEAKKGNPQLAKSDIPIQVTTLDKVLETLLSNNDPALSQVEFVPPRASLEYIMRQRQNAQPKAQPKQQ